MNPFWYRLLFRKAGKPRSWTRLVLFRKDRTARPLFYRVVHKKSGAVRPHFAYWAADDRPFSALPNTVGPGTVADEQVAPPALHPSEVILRGLQPPSEAARHWKKAAALPVLLTADQIVGHLAQTGSGAVVLCAGHDNYREIPGGVQLCIQREERLAVERGLAYLQFHPWQPLPCLAPADAGPDLPVTLLLNGALIGTAPMSALIEAARRVVAGGREARFVVHHMLGHQPEALADLAQAAQVPEAVFWLHDFFALCPSYTLLRNTIAFCGAPDLSSNACGLCIFGADRGEHQQRIAAFFDAVPVRAASPSQVTAEFWMARSTLPVTAVDVVPHVALEERPRATSGRAASKAPLTIGYLGAPVAHKGWPVFAEMMNRHSGPGMRFVVLSDKRPGLGEDDWQHVHVTTAAPDAMTKAVAGAQIDFVLHWANWPETFSFTTFEALAGDAWVLTNPVSGNVQATVRATGRGAVLDDPAALDRMVADGTLARLARERRTTAAQTEIVARPSALSFDLPGWG